MGDGRSTSAPTMAKPAWQAPLLLDLTTRGIGHGDCATGSSNVVTCGAGVSASALCAAGVMPAMCGNGGVYL